VRITFTSARSLTLGVAVALVTAACSAGSGEGADSDGATIDFVTPSDGASVSVPFDVELEASVPLDEPETGNHHAHIYFDTSTDSADYDIVYGTSWQVERPLMPGEHTLIVALANPDHSLAGPTQEIRVTVDGEGGGSDAGSSASPPPVIDY
jgi:hypothetical protein